MWDAVGDAGPRAIARYNTIRHIDVTVEGREHFPATGAVLLAARHYHHLWDGCAFVDALPRRVHIFVALDWVPNAFVRAAMERACALSRWPVALRSRGFSERGYGRDEMLRYVRNALRDAAQLLREGRVVAIFPEGFPTIDPAGTRKPDFDAFLPFEPGFLTVAALAESDGGAPVTILPVGLTYRATRNRWAVTVRVGAPLDRSGSRREVLARCEARVRELSAPAN